MKDNFNNSEEVLSKVLRAGRRTYFFDVRPTKAGDYYLTITESKKFTNEDGSAYYQKHKIYLYKEDFKEFQVFFKEAIDYIVTEKGEEVISDKHESYKNNENSWDSQQENKKESGFDNIKF